jgi:hypothetical protein
MGHTKRAEGDARVSPSALPFCAAVVYSENSVE